VAFISREYRYCIFSEYGFLTCNRTFFGGDDTSWSTPQATHTYFRNIQMWGSSAASNLTGQPISAAPLSVAKASVGLLAVLFVTSAAFLSGFL
jgi:hypothetical protein